MRNLIFALFLLCGLVAGADTKQEIIKIIEQTPFVYQQSTLDSLKGEKEKYIQEIKVIVNRYFTDVIANLNKRQEYVDGAMFVQQGQIFWNNRLKNSTSIDIYLDMPKYEKMAKQNLITGFKGNPVNNYSAKSQLAEMNKGSPSLATLKKEINDLKSEQLRLADQVEELKSGIVKKPKNEQDGLIVKSASQFQMIVLAAIAALLILQVVLFAKS